MLDDWPRMCMHLTRVSRMMTAVIYVDSLFTIINRQDNRIDRGGWWWGGWDCGKK